MRSVEVPLFMVLSYFTSIPLSWANNNANDCTAVPLEDGTTIVDCDQDDQFLIKIRGTNGNKVDGSMETDGVITFFGPDGYCQIKGALGIGETKRCNRKYPMGETVMGAFAYQTITFDETGIPFPFNIIDVDTNNFRTDNHNHDDVQVTEMKFSYFDHSKTGFQRAIVKDFRLDHCDPDGDLSSTELQENGHGCGNKVGSNDLKSCITLRSQQIYWVSHYNSANQSATLTLIPWKYFFVSYTSGTGQEVAISLLDTRCVYPWQIDGYYCSNKNQRKRTMKKRRNLLRVGGSDSDISNETGGFGDGVHEKRYRE